MIITGVKYLWNTFLFSFLFLLLIWLLFAYYPPLSVLQISGNGSLFFFFSSITSTFFFFLRLYSCLLFIPIWEPSRKGRLTNSQRFLLRGLFEQRRRRRVRVKRVENALFSLEWSCFAERKKKKKKNIATLSKPPDSVFTRGSLSFLLFVLFSSVFL